MDSFLAPDRQQRRRNRVADLGDLDFTPGRTQGGYSPTLAAATCSQRLPART